jgi:hypothetical protein
MRRVLPIAALSGSIVAALGASMASAATITPGQLWDGAVVITDATPQCEAFGIAVNSSLRALYREHLKSTDPKAAVIFQTDNLSHIVVIRSTSNNKDIAGNVPYCGIDFDPAMGESTTWLGGNVNFNVRRRFTAPRTTLDITGQATKFGNIDGCTITIRGSFLRRP